jgi:hypothetical protein
MATAHLGGTETPHAQDRSGVALTAARREYAVRHIRAGVLCAASYAARERCMRQAHRASAFARSSSSKASPSSASLANAPSQSAAIVQRRRKYAANPSPSLPPVAVRACGRSVSRSSAAKVLGCVVATELLLSTVTGPHPGHICARTAPRPCHICTRSALTPPTPGGTGTGLTPPTSAPGLASPLPRLHRDWPPVSSRRSVPGAHFARGRSASDSSISSRPLPVRASWRQGCGHGRCPRMQTPTEQPPDRPSAQPRRRQRLRAHGPCAANGGLRAAEAATFAASAACGAPCEPAAGSRGLKVDHCER